MRVKVNEMINGVPFYKVEVPILLGIVEVFPVIQINVEFPRVIGYFSTYDDARIYCVHFNKMEKDAADEKGNRQV